MPKHTIVVTVDSQGTPSCNPHELVVRGGDSILWEGPEHKGQFLGKVLGAKQCGFELAELPLLKVDNSKQPFSHDGFWDTWDPELSVSPDAEPGAYKYNVEVNGKILDPVVVVE